MLRRLRGCFGRRQSSVAPAPTPAPLLLAACTSPSIDRRLDSSPARKASGVVAEGLSIKPVRSWGRYGRSTASVASSATFGSSAGGSASQGFVWAGQQSPQSRPPSPRAFGASVAGASGLSEAPKPADLLLRKRTSASSFGSGSVGALAPISTTPKAVFGSFSHPVSPAHSFDGRDGRPLSRMSSRLMSLSTATVAGAGHEADGAFVNHGKELWEELRREWRKTPTGRERAKSKAVMLDHHLLARTMRDERRVLRLPHAVPLGQMIDVLTDLWEDDGLYD